jgi:hypothetical protein
MNTKGKLQAPAPLTQEKGSCYLLDGKLGPTTGLDVIVKRNILTLMKMELGPPN